MRLRLSIRTPSLAEAIAKQAKSKVMRAVAAARPKIQALVVDRGTQLIEKKLKMMKGRYQAALAAPGAIEVDDKGITLVVKDPLVLAYDGGRAAYDLKSRLLAHAKRFSKKGEPYVDIPFRHAAADVPRGIKNKAARIASRTGSDTVRVPQKTPGEGFVRKLQRGKLAQSLGLAPRKQKVEHKRGKYDDTIRTTNRGAAARYTTIRRISARSSPTSWWHPGFKAANVLERILPSLKKDIIAIVRDSLRGK